MSVTEECQLNIQNRSVSLDNKWRHAERMGNVRQDIKISAKETAQVSTNRNFGFYKKCGIP